MHTNERKEIPEREPLATGVLDKDLARQGSDELESFADNLKTNAVRAGSWTVNQSLALARIVKKVEDGAVDGTSTGPFWESVETDMEAEKVRPGTKASALSAHHSAFVADLMNHLPAGQFKALAGKLRTPGSRAGLWTENQNLSLARIVKKVEDGAADGTSQQQPSSALYPHELSGKACYRRVHESTCHQYLDGARMGREDCRSKAPGLHLVRRRQAR
jgi:hypothetical protein